MASLTIRRLDEHVKQRLRERAAADGVSLEEEVRRILSESVANENAKRSGLAAAIAAIVDPIGGLNLDIPAREPAREPPRFDSDEFGP